MLISNGKHLRYFGSADIHDSRTAFMEAAAERELLVRVYDGGQTRLVTHLDVSSADIGRAIEVIADLCA